MCLDFKDDAIYHDKVCKEPVREHSVLLFNFVFLFAIVGDFTGDQLMFYRVFIDNLQKSMSQYAVDFHTDSNDSVRFVFVYVFFFHAARSPKLTQINFHGPHET